MEYSISKFRSNLIQKAKQMPNERESKVTEKTKFCHGLKSRPRAGI